MSCPKTENLLLKLWSMRTTSSRRFVTALAPPLNSGCGLEPPLVALFAGKMPAATRDAEFGLIMQLGMMLPGNGEPCAIPAGATPPGQLAKRTPGATCVAPGTRIGVLRELKLPP